MKLFVTYNQAVKLKEIGFDQPCLGWFMKINPLGKEFIPDIIFDKVNTQEQVSTFGEENCLAPLKQEAIEWLLNKLDNNLISLYSIEIFADGSGSINRTLDKKIHFNKLNDAIGVLIEIAKNIK